jgi:hypothetical protein
MAEDAVDGSFQSLEQVFDSRVKVGWRYSAMSICRWRGASSYYLGTGFHGAISRISLFNTKPIPNLFNVPTFRDTTRKRSPRKSHTSYSIL